MPASRYLIVLPDDTAKPILNAINSGPKKSIWVKMFVFFRSRATPSRSRGKKARGVDVSHHAQSQPPQRQSRKSAIPQIPKIPPHRSNRQQSSCFWPHPRKIRHGRRRQNRLRKIPQLGKQKSNRNSRLRHRHHSQTRSPRTSWNVSKPTGSARNSNPAKTPT